MELSGALSHVQERWNPYAQREPGDLLKRLRSVISAFFSMRDTVRIAYCKRLALRKGFQLTEAKMNDNLFVLGQLDPLDQADEHLPV